MLIEEALKMWCPFSRVRQIEQKPMEAGGGLSAMVGMDGSFNRLSNGQLPSGSLCVATACACWHAADTAHGRCGLAGVECPS